MTFMDDRALCRDFETFRVGLDLGYCGLVKLLEKASGDKSGIRKGTVSGSKCSKGRDNTGLHNCPQSVAQVYHRNLRRATSPVEFLWITAVRNLLGARTNFCPCIRIYALNAISHSPEENSN